MGRLAALRQQIAQKLFKDLEFNCALVQKLVFFSTGNNGVHSPDYSIYISDMSLPMQMNNECFSVCL